MIRKLIASAFFLSTLLTHGLVNAQKLYSQAFGDKKAEPIVFLHGGPGYNAANFEATSAEKLAESGFYVIVYDRRGEGRSTDAKAVYTFEESTADLKSILKKYKLKRATLLGHSFGGMVATRFAEKYPKKVTSVVLVGAPMALQPTFKNIIAKSKAIYEEKEDAMNLNYIRMLEKMDTASIQYSSYCFMHAMSNGFYAPPEPSEESKAIYERFSTDSAMVKMAKEMTFPPVKGFLDNEQYTTLDLSENLKSLVKKGTKVYGIYGKNDGLYSQELVKQIGEVIGQDRLKYLENCSHNVFIDQQKLFIETLKGWLSP